MFNQAYDEYLKDIQAINDSYDEGEITFQEVLDLSSDAFEKHQLDPDEYV